MKRRQVRKTDNQRTESINRGGPVASEGAKVHPIHQLRGALGNRALGHFIQGKFRVSQPDDTYEQEADRVADQVMRMPDPANSAGRGSIEHSTAARDLQRACSKCEEDDEDKAIQRQADEGPSDEKLQARSGAGQSPGPTPQVAAQTNNLTNSGEPLPESTRAYFEPRFGVDFSHVRVHQDTQAAESARAVNALAYTSGHEIVFDTSQFAPDTSAGKTLLAHELTHVVQQAHSASRAMSEPVIQRFDAEEHRSLGNEASGTMMVNIGGPTAVTQFELPYGDVVMLSGDLFGPDLLGQLAERPGDRGRLLNTRDEIIYGLYWINPNDPRFGTGGIWANYVFDPTLQDVVKHRYQTLAAANAPHYAAPRGRDAAGQPLPGPAGEKGAGATYKDVHESAIRMAYQAGINHGNISQAMALEAAAQHFLSDAFSAGHIRTPIGAIRDYWDGVYPLFWYNLRQKIALDTAIQINAQDTNVSTIVTSVQAIYEKIIAQVQALVKHLPKVTLGDLLGKLFHDFDNEMGLNIGGSQMVFGDSNLDKTSPLPNTTNVTRALAVGAMRAGIQDIREAFSIGQTGIVLANQALYDGVRSATGAPAGAYVAETRLPKPDPSNAAQNWRAPSFETVWTQPMVGTAGPTVGDQITAGLQPGKGIRQQLDDLALQFDVIQHHRTGDVHPRRGYIDGFLLPLVAHPRESILSIINWAPNYGLRGGDRDDVSLATGEELYRQGDLPHMTTTARVAYISELIGGSVASDEEELVVRIFETADAAERPHIYELVEGHPWTGNWIEGVFVSDDEIWNALNRSRLARLRTLINKGWSGTP